MKLRCSVSLIVLPFLFLLLAAGSPEQQPMSRLKHFTSPEAVKASIPEWLNGYSLKGKGEIKNSGRYPRLPHIYYFTLRWEKEVKEQEFVGRVVGCSAGHGKDTKQQILEQYSDFQLVADERLNQPPFTNTFVLKSKERSRSSWQYMLFIDLRRINQDNQEVLLSGDCSAGAENNAPDPPGDEEAVSLMLRLLEPVD